MSGPLLLLVDDDRDLALIVERLGRGKYDVIVCPDASNAWDFLLQTLVPADGRQGPPMPAPDLVLLDVNLPGVNGIELCRRLREHPRLARLKVALFGHWDRPEDVAAGLEAGMNYVVSKDLLCEPAAWQGRLDELLGAAHGRLGRLFVPWKWTELSCLSPEEWSQLFNQAVWALRPEVRRLLVSRAARQVSPVFSEEALSPDGTGLDAARLNPAGRPQALAVFFAALAEQLLCLVGGAAAGALRGALARVAARSPASLTP